MVDISTVGIVPVPKKVYVGTISPRAFRRRIVRYWHWHPLGCRAIELSKTAQGVCDVHLVIRYRTTVLLLLLLLRLEPLGRKPESSSRWLKQTRQGNTSSKQTKHENQASTSSKQIRQPGSNDHVKQADGRSQIERDSLTRRSPAGLGRPRRPVLHCSVPFCDEGCCA